MGKLEPESRPSTAHALDLYPLLGSGFKKDPNWKLSWVEGVACKVRRAEL